MTVSSDKRREVIDRRMQVAALRLAGVRRQDVIAKQLKVSRPTICRDFKILDEIYQERAAEDIAKAKGLDIERTDEMILAIWQRAKRGDLGAIKTILSLMERRAKLLGLDAPTQQSLLGHDGGPVTIRVVYEEMQK